MFAIVRGSTFVTRGKHEIFSPLLCRLSYPAVTGAELAQRRGVFTMPQCGCRATSNASALPYKTFAKSDSLTRHNFKLASLTSSFVIPSGVACRAVALCGGLEESLIVGLRFPVTIGHMKKIISTNEAPAAIGPYSQAVRSGRFLLQRPDSARPEIWPNRYRRHCHADPASAGQHRSSFRERRSRFRQRR